jgi:hypothetical protein
MGWLLSRICPLVGPCTLREITSRSAFLPLPLEPSTASTSPECTVIDTSFRMTPVLMLPSSRCTHDPGSTCNPISHQFDPSASTHLARVEHIRQLQDVVARDHLNTLSCTAGDHRTAVTGETWRRGDGVGPSNRDSADGVRAREEAVVGL